MIRAGLAAASFALAAPATAQESAEDFADRTRAAIPEAGLGYPLIRCAALFRSFLLTIGHDRLAPEVLASAEEVERRLGGAATAVRLDENADLEQDVATEAVFDDIETVAEIYAARYEDNRKLRGHSWAGDAMLNSDRLFCETLLDRLR